MWLQFCSKYFLLLEVKLSISMLVTAVFPNEISPKIAAAKGMLKRCHCYY